MRFLTTIRERVRSAAWQRGGFGEMGHSRKVLLAGTIGAILSIPLILMANSSNPPAGESGVAVAGGSTCGTSSCHFHGTSAATGGVTANPPATYTPGGAAVAITVSLSPGAGGFEMSAVQGSGTAETQAGSFTAGSGSDVTTASGIQYIRHSGPATSFAFTWTPPATNVGNVTMNLAGVSGGSIFTNTYTLTPASGGSGGGTTLTVNPTSLTFTSNGAAVPASQTFQVTSSGSPLTFTTSVATSNGANWLSAAPPGGTTAQAVTVTVNPAGLATGTYTGSVSVTAASATNSPQSVGVTLNVGAGSSAPALTLSRPAVTFDSVNGASVNSQNIDVGSTGSPLSFTAAVATTSGGTWLSVTPDSGTTPTPVMVRVDPTGLSVGTTYEGSVTFTSSGASNSPQTLRVRLVVSPNEPPPTNSGPLSFRFLVEGQQSDGADHLVADGRGAADGATALGSGTYIIYSSNGGIPATGSSGTWTATGVSGFTPASTAATDNNDTAGMGGVLTLKVRLSPIGAAPLTGTMKIAATGTETGVTLSIDGGATYVPDGVGDVSIHSGSGGGAPTGGSTTPPGRGSFGHNE